MGDAKTSPLPWWPMSYGNDYRRGFCDAIEAAARVVEAYPETRLLGQFDIYAARAAKTNIAAKVRDFTQPLVAVPTRAAVIDELVAALRLFHPNNATELYERAAEDFYKATRLMAPGKSVPLELAYDSEQEAKRQELWRPFIGRWREQFIDAVLAKAGAK